MRQSSRRGLLALLAAVLILALLALGLLVFRRFQAEAPAAPSASPAETLPAAATPVPDTPSPSPTEDPVSVRAREILAGMDDREKICQLFVVYPDDIAGVGSITYAGEETRLGLERYPVGGLVYAQGNILSREAVTEMIRAQQGWSQIPLLTCVDEEGGRVTRVMGNLDTTWLDAMYTYRDQGPEAARQNAVTVASDLLALGFNTDFAPVADVWSNPQNTVIGDRAYSDDFAQAAELVGAAVEGFESQGLLCCLKHFPGHGDTQEDSHYGTAYVNKTLEELRQAELLPFQAGIEAGADMVMVGHLTVPALDDKPATVSHAIVTGLLREELGFDGVVITDSLEMSAATGMALGDGELCVQALEAGCDLLLGPGDLSAAVDGVTAAVDSGRLTWARIEESLQRILELKLRAGLLE